MVQAVPRADGGPVKETFPTLDAEVTLKLNGALVPATLVEQLYTRAREVVVEPLALGFVDSEFEAICSKIRVVGCIMLPVRCLVRVSYSAAGSSGCRWISVEVAIETFDRKTGAPTAIRLTSPTVLLGAEDPARFVAELVRETIRRTFEHELDECLYVDGVRMFDPHAADPEAKGEGRHDSPR